MRLDLRHSRQRFPIPAVDYAADAAHRSLVPSRGSLAALLLQLVNLGLGMKHLDRLKPAVNQTRYAVEKPEPQNISIEKERDWRSRHRKELPFQPSTPLRLRT